MENLEYIGFLGSLCFLSSYTLVQIGKMDGNGVVYTSMHALGGLFMLISLFGAWNAPVFLNNMFALTVSFIGFWRHFKESRLKGFSAEETEIKT